MPSYTPIAALPYPAMSDPPNGPDQLQQLARQIEPKLVNRFTSAVSRNANISAPTVGMLTFRDDAKAYEYWSGSAWTGIDQSIAVSSRSGVSQSTDRTFTTTESPALVRASVTLKNPSASYRMMWTTHSWFNCAYTWTVGGLYATIRHYFQQTGADDGHINWSNYSTAPGNAINSSGTWPTRTGFLAPLASVTISAWLTIEKSNATAGTLTMISGSCDLTVTGVSTV